MIDRTSSSTIQELNDVQKIVVEAREKAKKKSMLEQPMPGVFQSDFSSLNSNDFFKERINNDTDNNDESNLFEMELLLFEGDAIAKSLYKQLCQSEDYLIGNLPPKENNHDTMAFNNIQWKVSFWKKYYLARVNLDEVSLVKDQSIYNSDTSCYDIVKAGNLISQAKAELKDARNMLRPMSVCEEEEEEEETKTLQHLLSSLLDQVMISFTEIKNIINNTLDKCLVINKDSIVVQASSGMSLQRAYEGLMALSNNNNKESTILRDVMNLLFKNLWDKVFQQFFDSFCYWDVKEIGTNDVDTDVMLGVSSLSNPDNLVHTLKWRKRPSNKATTSFTSYPEQSAIWVEMLQLVTFCLRFITKNVLLERKESCHLFGEFLCFERYSSKFELSFARPESEASSKELTANKWNGPLILALHAIFYDLCLPSNPSHLSLLHSLLSSIGQEFETDLVNISLFPKAVLPLPFTIYIKNLQNEYAKKRRVTFLNKGRNIFKENDYFNTKEVGIDIPKPHPDKVRTKDGIPIYPDNMDPEFVMKDDAKSFFELHKCSISQVAYMLMELINETLEETVDSVTIPNMSRLLYLTSRDLFDLYRALIPTLYGSEIITIPRTAAICHNDCVFLAHSQLTLGYELQKKFKSKIESSVSDKIHQDTLSLAKSCTFIDMIPLFREMAEKSMMEMIERQKCQIYELLVDDSQAVLTLYESLCSNEAVGEWMDTERAVAAVQHHLQNISKAWKHVLCDEIYARSMGILVDKLLYFLLEEQIFRATDISEQASHFISSLFGDVLQANSVFFSNIWLDPREYCDCWERFNAIAKFMDMSLFDVNLALSDGLFRCITSMELSKLIHAAFDNTDERKIILKALSVV